MKNEYAFIAVAAAPVRRKPRHSSEMVNQLLFGETVQVIRSKGDQWRKVRSLHDGYEGWVTNSLLEQAEQKSADQYFRYTTVDLFSEIWVNHQRLHVTMGCSLPFFDEGKGKPGTTDFQVKGGWINRDGSVFSLEILKERALPWLNAPYLWGGRTPLGVDCSGFVQVIFKTFGIDLPRDAWQQAQTGGAIKKFKEAKPGDLVFFDRGEEIVHVGILLDESQVIHAAGKVKIDSIDKKGVVNPVTGKRELQLRAIRRIVDTN